MRVWTRQHLDVLETLNKFGIYRVKEKYIDIKMEEFSDYYKKLYDWYSIRAEKIVSKQDENIKYPIWVSIDEKMQLQYVPNTVILELEIEDDKIVITDMEKWGYVVNYFYLPYDNKDLMDHYKELEKYNIADEGEIAMGGLGNHYPLLKRKIIKSWDRLFEDYKLSNIRQGTIWEIKKENIISIVK